MNLFCFTVQGACSHFNDDKINVTLLHTGNFDLIKMQTSENISDVTSTCLVEAVHCECECLLHLMMEFMGVCDDY